MRHGKKVNHLSRKKGHRRSLLSNMACSLIEHKSINTTLAKEKGLTYLKCMKCGASRVVKKIEGHFTAKKRGQRRRDR